MKCETLFRDLELLVDGEIGREAENEVTDHLAGCEKCRSRLEALEEERLHLAEAFRVTELPEAYVRTLERRTLQALERARPAARFGLSGFLTDLLHPLVAALVAVIVTLLLGWETASLEERVARGLADARAWNVLLLILLTSLLAAGTGLVAGRLDRHWSQIRQEGDLKCL